MHGRNSLALWAAGVPLAFGFLPSACTGLDLREQLQPILREGETESQEWHVGPEVHVAETGTARFVRPLYEAFDSKRAMALVRFIDQYYRAPANEGYDEVIDHMADRLLDAGFGGDDDRLGFEVLEAGDEYAWTPRSAELVLLVDGEAERTLHAFDEPGDVDRVMLPINAPSCSIEGEVALHLAEVKAGMVLVTAVPPAQVLRRAKGRGAAAVISASLFSFNEDPKGQDRHLDAIQYDVLDDVRETMPVAHISPRNHQLIEEAVERARKRGASVRMRFEAEVEREDRPLRTMVATIYGDERPDEAVVMVSHVQEPGACDNATGVAGLLESARAYVELLEDEKLPWPSRSLVFVWGDEFRQSETWFANTDMKAITGISSDMTGQSRETGAIALLERMPDPGAIKVLAPDAHTPWGAGRVTADQFVPNGLAVIARCAMIDVGRVDGNWVSADHPWEGGSDHDIFIRREIPAVLFWHFTDFTYHTSLDRLEYVDAKEIRRTAAALLGTGLAVANAQPDDLDRYLKSLEKERELRVKAAKDVQDKELAAMWEDWCLGAREWLRNHCLGIDEKIPEKQDPDR